MRILADLFRFVDNFGLQYRLARALLRHHVYRKSSKLHAAQVFCRNKLSSIGSSTQWSIYFSKLSSKLSLKINLHPKILQNHTVIVHLKRHCPTESIFISCNNCKNIPNIFIHDNIFYSHFLWESQNEIFII